MPTEDVLEGRIRPLPFASIILANVFVAVAYVALGLVGMTVAIHPGNVTPVWPPSGLALAAILMLGHHMWPGIWLGAFLVNFQGYISGASTIPIADAIAVACAIGAGSFLQPLFGALMLRRFVGTADFFQKWPCTVRFFVLVPMMCLISSTIGTISLAFGGVSSWENFGELWLTWWLGDSVGVLLVTPLFLAWSKKQERLFSESRKFEAVIAFVAVVVSSAIAFKGILPAINPNFPLAYLPVPFILWAAYRFEEKGATIGLLVISSISAWGTSQGFGPFIVDSVNTSLLLLQVYIAFTVATALFIVAVSNERRKLEQGLENARDELESKVDERTTHLEKEIAERKGTQDALIVAKQEAETANRAKSEFLAAMSHDLRTPLNAILGFAEILSNQYFGPISDKYKEYADDIHISGEHLLELVNDILDISTIEAGKLSLNKEMLMVNEMVAESFNAIGQKAQDKGIKLITEASNNLPPLYADKRATRQILLNLLTNAVKFTPEGGMITVSAKASKQETTLKITDTGQGIPAEKLPKLTDPFNRGEQDPHKTVDGWGLGLSITKSLIDLHDGILDIKSKVGKGTTVTMTFPNDAP